MLTHSTETMFAMAQYQQERALSEARRNHLAKMARGQQRQGFRLTWRLPRLEDVFATEYACTLNPVAC